MQVNFDDLMGLIMEYFPDERKLDENETFLDQPLIPVSLEPPEIIAGTSAKPQSPEQLRALVTLTDFSKPKPLTNAPKRRVVHPTQQLV